MHNVSAYLVDNKNVPHEFWCHLPYSHGSPERFTLKVFAKDEKDPVAFTRKAFERQNRSFIDNLGFYKSNKKKRDDEIDKLINALESQ